MHRALRVPYAVSTALLLDLAATLTATVAYASFERPGRLAVEGALAFVVHVYYSQLMNPAVAVSAMSLTHPAA